MQVVLMSCTYQVSDTWAMVRAYHTVWKKKSETIFSKVKGPHTTKMVLKCLDIRYLVCGSSGLRLGSTGSSEGEGGGGAGTHLLPTLVV